MFELIPIVAITCSIGLPLSIPIVYFVLDYRKRKRIFELYHQERMAAIERGMDLPPLPAEFLRGNSSTARNRSALLPGLIWLFIGVAIIAGFGISHDHDQPYWLGFIPAGIGLAYLVYYAVEGRKLHQLSLEEAQARAAAAPPPNH